MKKFDETQTKINILLKAITIWEKAIENTSSDIDKSALLTILKRDKKDLNEMKNKYPEYFI